MSDVLRGARLLLATGFLAFAAHQLAQAPLFNVIGIAVVVLAGALAGSRWAIATLPAAFLLGVEVWYALEASPGTPRWSRDDSARFLVTLQIAIALVIAGLAWVGVWAGEHLTALVRNHHALR